MDRFLLIERDGVVNVKLENGVLSPEEFQFLPFVQEAFVMLARYDFKPIILSDQSALSTQLDSETLDSIHLQMEELIQEFGGKVFDTIVNPNGQLPEEACALPQPGLLHLAARKHQFNIQETTFLTCHTGGLQAGWAAGCQTVFVRSGKPFKTDRFLLDSPQQPDMTRKDILDAVVRITNNPEISD